MKWLDALKIFNRDHKGTWCILVDIMNGKHMRRQETIQGSGQRERPKGSKNKK